MPGYVIKVIGIDYFTTKGKKKLLDRYNCLVGALYS